MLARIKEVVKTFLEESENKEIYILSHNDTDGITSAAIIIKCLKRIDKKFTINIVKNLTPEIIHELPKDKTILFLDLASNSLNYIKEKNLGNVFIIDHHEISQEVPENIHIINPQLHDKHQIGSAGLCYLFAKQISEANKDLASLAVVGMIGDMLERDMSKLNSEITRDAEAVIKKGVLLYPSTRPLNRVLEFSSDPFIPGVTGNTTGVFQILREAKIEKINGKYKTLIELDEEEMARLSTAIILRRVRDNHHGEIIGNIFLVKMFNKLEDAREISAKINAASRQGNPYLAILFCLEEQSSVKKIEESYAKYKQLIVSGLNTMNEIEKVEGRGYIILNAREKIRDTIIGTITSILSMSSLYEEGSIIIGMAYDKEKIKASVRLAGRNGRNVRELMEQVIAKTGGEFGGHYSAAGSLINREKEKDFIEELKRNLEVQVVKL
jgi:RecJ-like exonuclease